MGAGGAACGAGPGPRLLLCVVVGGRRGEGRRSPSGSPLDSQPRGGDSDLEQAELWLRPANSSDAGS